MKNLIHIILLFVSFGVTAQSSYAGSATWNLNPTSSDWNTAVNWTPATVPNSLGDIATFDNSNSTTVSISTTDTRVNGIVFNPGASAFTITANGNSLVIGDGGITNNSGVTQTFATVRDPSSGEILLIGSARAGVDTAFMIGAASEILFKDVSSADHAAFTAESTQYYFVDNATAEHATFLNKAGAEPGGSLWFDNRSSAGNAIIVNEGATKPGEYGGRLQFVSFATAGNATITANGGSNGGPGGVVYFLQGSTAAASTLIANGGTGDSTSGATISFFQDSTGGLARAQIYGNANLDISRHHNSSSVTLGSLEGDGIVYLGAGKLTVGNNDLNTTFSGSLQNGGNGGGHNGSLVKNGKGKLTLASPGTYNGGTTVTGGTLLTTNKTGSATGRGAVSVEGGSLGGNGKIDGTVTIGAGTKNAFLAPGNGGGVGTLTIRSGLTFGPLATYSVALKSSAVTTAQVTAAGATINSGALISLFDLSSGTLASGTVFTVIHNTSATPIVGTFSNLADGATITVSNNTFQANYEGGDGNDLTLTVVP